MRGVWVVMVMGVVGMVVTSALGQDSNRHRNAAKPKKKHKCKYFWEGVEGPCDPDTMIQTISFPLKKGVNCPPFRNFTQPCRHDDHDGDDDNDDDLDLMPNHRSFKGCKYDRPGGQWTECGPGILTRNKVMTLLPGQPPSCPPTKTKTTPCKKAKKKDKKARKKAAKKARRKSKKGKGKGKGCKYQKGEWSACDLSTNLRQRELTLRKGDSSVCLPRKVITKKCNKACKYIKGPWSQCDHMTKEKIRQLTLKKGDPSVCNATSIVKPCRQRGHFTAAKTSQCRYKPQGGWGACEIRTNTMKRVLILKAGDPQLCTPTKELSAKCKKQCKFAKGAWSDCDESSGLRTRTDELVKGEAAHCEATRTISRKCGKGNGCKYDVGDWGQCEEGSQQRSRIKTLVTGDPEKCQQQLTITRPCFRPDGQENCFLGPWGDYGPCLNGVMTKRREIMAGGAQCTRKAVKTRPC